MDKQQIIDYIRHTPNNSNVNVVKGMLNSEGGGSSDFSTAEVTIINNSGYETEIRCATYFDDEYGRFSGWSVYSDGQNDTVANVILYKGEAFISCENNIYWSFASATGDIEIDSDNPDSAYVRGNGTITLAHQ